MKSNPGMTTPYILLALAFVAAGILVGSYLQTGPDSNEQKGGNIKGLLWPNPKKLSQFSLTDHHGEPLTLESLKGKWSFLFFGYTNCPDVCPTTLTTLNSVDRILQNQPELEGKYQVIFVSVDQDRDSLEQLAEYVTYFNDGFLAANGDEQQLNALTKQLGIMHMRVEQDAGRKYLMDHTASVLLIDPEGRLIAIFSAPQDAEDVSQRFLDIVSFIEESS